MCNAHSSPSISSSALKAKNNAFDVIYEAVISTSLGAVNLGFSPIRHFNNLVICVLRYFGYDLKSIKQFTRKDVQDIFAEDFSFEKLFKLFMLVLLFAFGIAMMAGAMYVLINYILPAVFGAVLVYGVLAGSYAVLNFFVTGLICLGFGVFKTLCKQFLEDKISANEPKKYLEDSIIYSMSLFILSILINCIMLLVGGGFSMDLSFVIDSFYFFIDTFLNQKIGEIIVGLDSIISFTLTSFQDISFDKPDVSLKNLFLEKFIILLLSYLCISAICVSYAVTSLLSSIISFFLKPFVNYNESIKSFTESTFLFDSHSSCVKV